MLTNNDLRQVISEMLSDQIGGLGPPQYRPASLPAVPGSGFSIPPLNSSPTFMNELPSRFNDPGYVGVDQGNPFMGAPPSGYSQSFGQDASAAPGAAPWSAWGSRQSPPGGGYTIGGTSTEGLG